MIENCVIVIETLSASLLFKASVTGLTWAMLHERFSRPVFINNNQS